MDMAMSSEAPGATFSASNPMRKVVFVAADPSFPEERIVLTFQGEVLYSCQHAMKHSQGLEFASYSPSVCYEFIRVMPPELAVASACNMAFSQCRFDNPLQSNYYRVIYLSCCS